MKLDEYLKAKRQQISDFEIDWCARQAKEGKDDWPDEMSSADWDEQMHFMTALPGHTR